MNDVVAAVQLAATNGLVPTQDQPPPPGRLPEWGNAAPVGLAIVLVLLLATVVLIWNMSKRIKRLPESFDDSAEQDGSENTPAGSGAGDGAEPLSS